MKKIILYLFVWFFSFKLTATTWTVTNSGNSFSPVTLTINVGDAVNFDISNAHNAVEISQATWNANGTTRLAGGFQTPFGGGLVQASSLGLGTHYYICDPHASSGMKGRIIVQSCTPPTQPVSISGTTTVCQGSINNYTIGAVSGATNYTWSLPSGWSGSSTSTSIAVTAGSSSGSISVTANNSCSASSARTLSITVNNLPPEPSAISGNTSICPGSTNAYNIVSVSGATSYSWILPSGWTGVSTNTSMTATAGNTGGNLTVSANNSCGSSQPSILAVTINSLPPIQGNISGNAVVCSGSSNTYTIAPVGGASNYTWTLPSGWTGVSTTTSISTIAANTGGNISVTANNTCGSTPAKILSVTSTSIPPTPGNISGMTNLCSGSVIPYSINAVNGATGYTWTLPSGWIGNSTTNTISATAFNNSGAITVRATNSCGTSLPQSLNVTVNAQPSTPGIISGNSSICAGSSNAYNIPAVAGASSYSWILPSGWTGNSTINSLTATAGATGGTISVSANNACGSSAARTLNITVNSLPEIQGTITGNATICPATSNTYSVTPLAGAVSYTWNLPSGWSGSSSTNSIMAIAGVSGNISVTANNPCGSTLPKVLAVTVSTNLPNPDTITGIAAVCPGNPFTYSIPPISGATSYTWALPSGWTGNSTTNSISVTAGIIAGNISVKANNSCGSSPIVSLAVSPGGTGPATPGSIIGNSSICAGSSNTYSIPASAGATSYTWTLPSGWTGNSSTTSIIATAGATGGNISVRANNFCGTTPTVSLAVATNGTAPSSPGNIFGFPVVCSGSLSTFLIPPVNGATGYTWTLPSGWSGSSTTSTIMVTAGSTNGNILVTANNGCGSSSPGNLAVSSITINTGIQQTGLTLTAATPGANYQWINCTSGNQIIPGQTNQSFTPSVSGSYAVIITQNGCIDTSVCFNLSTVATPDFLNDKLMMLYPNPTTGAVFFKIDGIVPQFPALIEIYNLNGQLVYQTKIKGVHEGINLHHLHAGLYYIKWNTDQGKIIKKLSIQY